MTGAKVARWDDVKAHANGAHLLLGNGFSVALKPDIFTYTSLLEQVDWTPLTPCAQAAFEALKTKDFEAVIKGLSVAADLADCYETTDSELAAKLRSDAKGLREALVRTIAGNHPERPGDLTEEEYRYCRDFLRPFKKRYSLNYDLLLYWALMHDENDARIDHDDGFRQGESSEDVYVAWDMSKSLEGQNTYYLHGALHLFDSRHQLRKATYSRTGRRLTDQIRAALAEERFPLIVAEGTSEEKLDRIMHSAYLSRGLRSLSQITGTMFVLGMALSENDAHVLEHVASGKLSTMYISVFGDPDAAGNQELMRRAGELVARSQAVRGKRGTRLTVEFFDAATVPLWREVIQGAPAPLSVPNRPKPVSPPKEDEYDPFGDE